MRRPDVHSQDAAGPRSPGDSSGEETLASCSLWCNWHSVGCDHISLCAHQARPLLPEHCWLAGRCEPKEGFPCGTWGRQTAHEAPECHKSSPGAKSTTCLLLYPDYPGACREGQEPSPEHSDMQVPMSWVSHNQQLEGRAPRFPCGGQN